LLFAGYLLFVIWYLVLVFVIGICYLVSSIVIFNCPLLLLLVNCYYCCCFYL